MSTAIHRVQWNLAGTKYIQQQVEFSSYDNAMGWAEGLLAAGATEVILTELIVGRIIRLSDDPTTLPFNDNT